MTQTIPTQVGRPAPPAFGGTAARLSVFRSALYRATGIFGKDLVRYAPVPLIIAGVAAIIAGAPRLMELLYPHRGFAANMARIGIEIFLIFLPITCYSVGLAIGGDEEDTKTRLFLDQLPGSRVKYVLGKLAAGVVLIAAWILLCVFGVGPIAGNGLDLYHKLASSFKDGLGSFTVFEPVIGFYITANVGLYFTGAAAGAVFRSVVIAAFGGAGLLIAYMVLAFGLTHGLWDSANRSSLEDLWLGFVVFGIWSLIMTLTMLNRYRFAREDAERSEIAEATEAVLEQVHTARRRTGFDPPSAHPLRLPLILTASLCLFVPGLLGPDFLLWPVIAVPAAMLLGVLSWLPEERDGSRCFLYALPVGRGAIYWERLRSLLGRVILLLAAGGAGLLLGAIRSPGALARVDSPYIRCLLFCVAVTAVSCAVCGNLFALFHRLKVAAGFLALTVGCLWGLLALKGLRYSTMLPGAGPTHGWIYAAWIALVMLVLPVVTGYLAFCRSPLLELSEERRGAYAVPVLLLLLIWGSLLITMSPPQLAMVVWG